MKPSEFRLVKPRPESFVVVLYRFLINQVANNKFRGYKLKMMGKMDLYLNSSKCRRK